MNKLSYKILIVGGTGFLGYHLAKRCIEKGWLVTSISTNIPKKIRFLKKVDYIKLDITKKKQFNKLRNKEFNFIVNFGGYVNHFEKIKTYKSHYIGCKNLVENFKKKKIQRFIQIGSCTEYGKYKSPQKEIFKNKKIKHNSTYGKSKYLATNYLINKIKKNNFPFTILRLYLVYGPKQDFNRLIPIIIKGCLLGNQFPCSSGLQYRDFLYIEDFIDVVFKCLKNNKSVGEIFNIGFGKPIRVKKVIKMINKIIQSGKPEFNKIPLRKDEQITLYPNIKKSNQLLNWKPKISFLAGIRRTIKYYKQSFK